MEGLLTPVSTSYNSSSKSIENALYVYPGDPAPPDGHIYATYPATQRPGVDQLIKSHQTMCQTIY